MIIFTIFTQLSVTRAPPGGNRHRHHNHLHWHGHLDRHFCHHYIAAGNKALRSPQSTSSKIVNIIIFMTVIIYLLLALFWLNTFSIEMPGKKRDCLENSERKSVLKSRKCAANIRGDCLRVSGSLLIARWSPLVIHRSQHRPTYSQGTLEVRLEIFGKHWFLK